LMPSGLMRSARFRAAACSGAIWRSAALQQDQSRWSQPARNSVAAIRRCRVRTQREGNHDRLMQIGLSPVGARRIMDGMQHGPDAARWSLTWSPRDHPVRYRRWSQDANCIVNGNRRELPRARTATRGHRHSIVIKAAHPRFAE
jgi:hypothetical protein